jgi:transposase-like protein
LKANLPTALDMKKNSNEWEGPKTILNETGEMKIEFSRDRNGDFEPQLVKKR